MRTTKVYRSSLVPEFTLTVTPVNRPMSDYEAVLSHSQATHIIHKQFFLYYTPDEIVVIVENDFRDKYSRELDLVPTT